MPGTFVRIRLERVIVRGSVLVAGFPARSDFVVLLEPVVMGWTPLLEPRSVQIFDRRRSRCLAIVEVEHSSETCAAIDRAVVRGSNSSRPDQLVSKALVVAFLMVVRHEFVYCMAQ